MLNKREGGLTYLPSCQGNKVVDSEWDHLTEQADDNPPHLVTSYRDVKKHLDTHTCMGAHTHTHCQSI